MRQPKEAVVLGPGSIKHIIKSNEVKAVYTTYDISRNTIIETAKKYWEENKKEDSNIKRVER